MFRLVRFFAIANAIALIGVTAVLYLLYRHVEVDETIRTAEQHNATLARTIANAISPIYEKYAANEGIRGQDSVFGEEAASQVDGAIRSLVRGLPVVKVVIYDRDQNIVYSSAADEVGASGADDRIGFDSALVGQPRSEIEFRSYIEGVDRPLRDRQVVETYTPFYSDHGTVFGVFELYSDVTANMQEIDDISTALLIGLGIIFSLLYAGLLFAIRHASGIIAGQYHALEESRADVDAKNDRLRTEIAYRNEVEAELRRAREDAEKASQTKSRFLANMSHELRTPLNAVIGFSEIIADQHLGTVDPPRYRDYASDIRESGRCLLALVDDILDLSKIESGGERLNLELCDISDLIRTTLKSVEPQCERNGNEIFVAGQGGPVEIVSDKAKILSILTNLVGNAAKFSRNGQITVSIQRDLPTDRLDIEISDTGIGMHTDRIDALFDDFTLRDNMVSRAYGGTGLGLTITRHYCEMLNGEFRIDSEIGKGTSVTVSLPARSESFEEMKAAAE
jgi:signal transduction histidine kinase